MNTEDQLREAELQDSRFQYIQQSLNPNSDYETENEDNKQQDDSNYNNEPEEISPIDYDQRRKSAFRRLAHIHYCTKKEREVMEKYESLDYDIIENDLYKERKRSETKKDQFRTTIANWAIFTLIGIFTGSTAALIGYSVDQLSNIRWHMSQDKLNDGEKGIAFALFLGLAIAYVIIPAFLVAFIAPGAGGSGIPELKAYLNGTNLPEVFTLKVLIAKVVGIVFAVSGGLICGKEGPMVHTGAVLAFVFCHIPKIPKLLGLEQLKRFRNDHDKRDFVSGGGAAGVAAAFGAPLGGVLFSLEEASSFWSVSLTWRVYFCGALSSFFLNLITSAIQGNINNISSPGLIDFGEFINSPYQLYEIPIFIAIGAFGGLVGALFNSINHKLSKFRRNNLKGKKLLRFLEAVGVAAFSATILFWLPTIYNNDCQDIIKQNTNCDCSYKSYPTQNYQYYCSSKTDFDNIDRCQSMNDTTYNSYTSRYECNSTQYNSLASLSFQNEEQVIHNLFHSVDKLQIPALLIYQVIIFILAELTYGIAVPSGLFVPVILIGSSYGRIFGELMRMADPAVFPGTYALIGATSSLGGVTRMTISMTMIILGTTYSIQYLIPIMLVLTVSKWIGDIFNIALYDIHVELLCVPFVENVPQNELQSLLAKDVMSKPVVCFRAKENAKFLYDTLLNCTHNGFPVLNKDNKFIGLMLKSHIVILIKHKIEADGKSSFAFNEIDENDLQKREELKIDEPSLEDFGTSLQSKTRKIEELNLNKQEYEKLASFTINFRKYMNPVSFTVHEQAPLTRVFSLYRSMGIRHLTVVNTDNHVVGILTRKELRTDFKTDLF